MRQFQAGTHDVFSLGLGPDGHTLLASVLFDGVFRWNLADAAPAPHCLPAQETLYNRAFVFAPDGSASWVNIYGRFTFDAASGEVHKAPLSTGGSINTQVALAGGRLLTGHGFERMGVGLWRAVAGREWENEWFLDFRGSFHGMTTGFHADRFYLFRGTGPGDSDHPTLTAHSLADREVIAEARFPYRGAGWLQASPDGSAVVGTHEATLVVWRPGANPEKVRPGGRKHITRAAFHPSGKHLAVTSNDETVRLLDTQTWAVARQFAWNIGRLKVVAFSPDGTLAAAGGERGRVVVWDVDV